MKPYKKNYIQISNYIYIFALVVFLASSILPKTMWVYTVGENFELLLKILRYVSYLACIFKMFFDNYYFSDFWKLSIMIIFVLAASYFSASMILFTYSLLFVSSYGIEKKMIIKYAVCIQFCLLFVIIITSQIGLNIDFIFDAGARNRHGLGFTWTTTASIFFFFICLEYIYIREKRMKIVEYIVILTLSYILYKLTDARLTFALSIMTLVFFWLFSNFKFVKLIMEKMRVIWVMMPFIVTFFSYYIHRSYVAGNWFWDKFNNLISGRLKLGKAAIEQYGIKVFGQEIEWIGYAYQAKEGVYNYVDCSYLQIVIQYGVVLLGLCLIAYAYILLRATRENDYYLCGCILIVLAHSITEPFLLNLVFNPFPLLAVSYLGERKRRKEIVNNEFT